jgi:hypothetical protein
VGQAVFVPAGQVRGLLPALPGEGSGQQCQGGQARKRVYSPDQRAAKAALTRARTARRVNVK